jgi:hypothetical protein
MLTVKDAIEILGGPTKTGRLVERTAQCAGNWRRKNKFPANTYEILKRELEDRNIEAPMSLWGMKEPT